MFHMGEQMLLPYLFYTIFQLLSRLHRPNEKKSWKVTNKREKTPGK